jgi:hypothetical protein
MVVFVLVEFLVIVELLLEGSTMMAIGDNKH